MGAGTEMAKLDIKSAYRMVPVHPDDRPLLGVRWEDEIYVDTALPFGLRSAPKIFNALADALEWILRANGIDHVWHYLDDFIMLGTQGSGECAFNRDLMKHLCSQLGVPLAEDKCEGPATTFSWAGHWIVTNAIVTWG